jgi:hypothetical protein
MSESTLGEAHTSEPEPILSAHPSTLPTTTSRSFTIGSILTHFWIQKFQDRVVICISQLSGKIGNFLLCQAYRSDVTGKVDFEITHLLGAARDDPVLDVYGRQLAERLCETQSYSALSTVVLGVSLHPVEGENPLMMRSIIDLSLQLYQDALSVSTS